MADECYGLGVCPRNRGGALLGGALWGALQFGADEGYELMKAFLVSLGHPLYTAVWNDQPPLHTEMVALLFRISDLGAAPAVTVAFTVLYLRALYGLAARRSGHAAGLLAAGLACASPLFLKLGVSVILEMPAMSLAAASAWLLSIYFSRLQRRWLILSGLLFGCALQVKLTAGIFLPAMAAEFLRRGGWGHRPMDSVRGVMPGGGAPPKTGLELKAASPEGSQAGQINPHPSPSGLAQCPAFSLREAFAWLISAVAAFGAVVAAFCPIEAFKVFWLSHFSGGTLDAAAAASLPSTSARCSTTRALFRLQPVWRSSSGGDVGTCCFQPSFSPRSLPCICGIGPTGSTAAALPSPVGLAGGDRHRRMVSGSLARALAADSFGEVPPDGGSPWLVGGVFRCDGFSSGCNVERTHRAQIVELARSNPRAWRWQGMPRKPAGYLHDLIAAFWGRASRPAQSSRHPCKAHLVGPNQQRGGACFP